MLHECPEKRLGLTNEETLWEDAETRADAIRGIKWSVGGVEGVEEKLNEGTLPGLLEKDTNLTIKIVSARCLFIHACCHLRDLYYCETLSPPAPHTP